MKTRLISLLAVALLLACGTERKEVTGIALDTPELSLYTGETALLTATILPEGMTAPVSWRSLRQDVASVEDGLVTALSPGMSEVIATSGAFSAGCRVTVLKVPVHVTGVTLSEHLVYLQPSETLSLTATVSPADADDATLRWSSSDETIVTVEDGSITALREGEADISVTTAEGGFTDVCHVIVRTIVHVTGVHFPSVARTAFTGVPMSLAWVVTPDNATDKSVTWRSSDETVVTVEEGVVTGLKEGTATVTVTTVDGGYSASCTITVIRAEGAVDSQGFESFEKHPVEWDSED